MGAHTKRLLHRALRAKSPPADTTDFAPSVSPEALAAARVRWGLDAVPLTPKAPEGVTIKENPGTFARALMAKRPPKEWEEMLRATSPVSDAHSWLYLTWKETPGKPETGRWVIYECLPAPLVPTEMRMRLEDIPYWEKPQDQRMGRELMVSAFQWWMWRDLRVWARPFWCLQGDTGGTPMFFSEIEQRFLKLTGQPTTPPHLGALSFAPYDGRVERALARRDRLAKVGHSIERLKATGTSADIVRETEAAERAFRTEFLRWWADRLQDQTEFLEWYQRRTEADRTLRKTTRAEFLAAQRLDEVYLETGAVPVLRPDE